MPESCSTAALVELNCLPNLIQKFDSDAMLLSNLIPEFSSARTVEARRYLYPNILQCAKIRVTMLSVCIELGLV